MIEVVLEPAVVTVGADRAVDMVVRNLGPGVCHRLVLRRRSAGVPCDGAVTLRVDRLAALETARLPLRVGPTGTGDHEIPIRDLAWVTEGGAVVRHAPPPPVLRVEEGLREASRPRPERGPIRPVVFVSYRVSDTADVLPTVVAELQNGGLAVFSDHDLRPADRWPAVLERELAEASVLVALIGQGWLAAATCTGRRRLDEDGDWVRREVGTALALGMPVLPLLVDGARMPHRQELPAELSPLTEYQGLRWRPGAGRLLPEVRRLVG